MNNDIFTKSEKIFQQMDAIQKFETKYGVAPPKEFRQLFENIQQTIANISDIPHPETQEELFEAELKRRLQGEALNLDNALSKSYNEFEDTIVRYSIPKEDIEGLKGWLIQNKSKTNDVLERLFYSKNLDSFELAPKLDIPSVRNTVGEFARTNVQTYHNVLGEHFQQLTKIGEFLKNIKADVTYDNRSYFDYVTKFLAISIHPICFTREDGLIDINPRNLLRIYGHEGMGHALNKVLTEKNNLPFFLKKEARSVEPTAESVAQFYQNVIFDTVRESSNLQKKLGLDSKFEEIYQEAKDLQQLEEYSLKFKQYGITVLADKTLGNPHDPETLVRKVDKLSEFSLFNSTSLNFVEESKHNFDPMGNLYPGMVSELRYCANPVKKTLAELSKKGIEYNSENRSRIDETFLRGFWTSIGFVDNARLRILESD